MSYAIQALSQLSYGPVAILRSRKVENMGLQALAQVRDEKSYLGFHLILFFHAVQNLGDVVLVLAQFRRVF